jgi:hypothetical protein
VLSDAGTTERADDLAAIGVTKLFHRSKSYYTLCGAVNCHFFKFAASTACLGAHTEYSYQIGACEHAVWKGVADSWRGGRSATYHAVPRRRVVYAHCRE